VYNFFCLIFQQVGKILSGFKQQQKSLKKLIKSICYEIVFKEKSI